MRDYPALTLVWAGPIDEDRVGILLAAIDALQPTAIDEFPDGVRVFFSTRAERDAARAVSEQFPDVTCSAVDVPDDDWAARSQDALEPVRVANIVVAPPWKVTPALRAEAGHLIVIEPSMGFGTGHHATTRLCLRWLQRVPVAGLDALDVGTGSGVLAIAASMLGARSATGIDVDPDALDAARDNVRLNGVERVELRAQGLADAAGAGGFGVVTANLTGALLARSASQLLALASPGAHLIASGFQPYESDDVIGALEAAGWVSTGTLIEDDWVGFAGVRPGSDRGQT